MKKLVSLLTVFLCTAISLPAGIKIEFGPIPEWQKPVIDKVKFDVKTRSLSQILNDEGDKAGTPSFLVFTAEAAETLSKRLLWVDIEVVFSNGAVRKFTNVGFHLLERGIEADVRKLDTLEIDNIFGGEARDPKPVEITKLRISNTVCK